MEILISKPNDVQRIAKCQAICFPGSFAVKLGPSCLGKSLSWFFANQNRFLVHVEQDGKVIGFLGGFMPIFIGDGSKSGMLNFAMKEAFIGLLKKPWLLFQLELWRFGFVFLKNKLRLKQPISKSNAEIAADVQDYLNSVALTIIAIHPDFRGKGLVDDLLGYADEYAEMNKKQVLCLGVKQNNSIATRAYVRNGWVIYKKLNDSFVMKKYLTNIGN